MLKFFKWLEKKLQIPLYFICWFEEKREIINDLIIERENFAFEKNYYQRVIESKDREYTTLVNLHTKLKEENTRQTHSLADFIKKNELLINNINTKTQEINQLKQANQEYLNRTERIKALTDIFEEKNSELHENLLSEEYLSLSEEYLKLSKEYLNAVAAFMLENEVKIIESKNLI